MKVHADNMSMLSGEEYGDGYIAPWVMEVAGDTMTSVSYVCCQDTGVLFRIQDFLTLSE